MKKLFAIVSLLMTVSFNAFAENQPNNNLKAQDSLPCYEFPPDLSQLICPSTHGCQKGCVVLNNNDKGEPCFEFNGEAICSKQLRGDHEK